MGTYEDVMWCGVDFIKKTLKKRKKKISLDAWRLFWRKGNHGAHFGRGKTCRFAWGVGGLDILMGHGIAELCNGQPLPPLPIQYLFLAMAGNMMGLGFDWGFPCSICFIVC